MNCSAPAARGNARLARASGGWNKGPGTDRQGKAARLASTEDAADIRAWIGRSESATDLIAPAPVAALNATLDRDDPPPRPGDPLPPLYHWLYCRFLGLAKTEELGEDGHPRRGGFLPPVRLPRRMWAASEVRFEGALRIGEEAERVSVIEDVAEKTGHSGPLVFVTIRHEISGPSGRAVTDRQTVVYREAPAKGEAAAPGSPAPKDAEFWRRVTPNEALLFRYSALIFNAHRIHYDRPFATGVEGYPGLVVHGPLVATLLADLVRRERESATIARFAFRAVRPLFAGSPFTVNGRSEKGGTIRLWTADSGNALATEAEAELA